MCTVSFMSSYCSWILMCWIQKQQLKKTMDKLFSLILHLCTLFRWFSIIHCEHRDISLSVYGRWIIVMWRFLNFVTRFKKKKEIKNTWCKPLYWKAQLDCSTSNLKRFSRIYSEVGQVRMWVWDAVTLRHAQLIS